MTFPSVDTVTLGNDLMPGQWILMPTYMEYGWQIQKGWALSGATVRPIGDELVTAQFIVRFWSSTDWDKFQPFRKKYFRKAAFSVSGNLTYAIGINHPELNAIGVTSVVPRKVPVFTNDGRGLWTGVVEFLQYRKPKPALESPNAAIPSAAAPTPSATDALQQEMLLAQQQIMGAR